MDQDTLPEEEQGAHDKLEGGLRPDETAALDQMEAGLNDSGPAGAGGNRLQSVGKFIGKNKKSFIGGGVGAGIIGGVIALTPVFGAFELLHIFNNVLADVRKEITMELDKELNKVTDKVLQRQIDKAMNKTTSATEENGPMAEEADKVKLESVKPEMENAGLDPTFNSDGVLTGIKDPTNGENLSESELDSGNTLTKDSGLGSTVDGATQALDMGDRRVYLPLEADHFQVSFDFFPTTDDTKAGPNGEPPSPEEEMDTVMEDKTINGASSSEIAGVVGSEDVGSEPTGSPEANTTYDPKAPPDASSGPETTNTGGAIEGAANKAVGDFKAGTPSDVAVQNASEDWLASEESGVGDPIAPMLMFCNLQKGVQDADKLRAFHLITLMIRHGNMLLTAASQLKEGKLTAKGLGGLLTLFNGNSSAKSVKSDKGAQSGLPESALSFSSSAAWQRDTSGTVGSSTPDLDPLSNPASPPKDTFSKIFTKVQSIPGENFTCKAANSPLGFVVGIVATGVQLVLNGFDFGAEEVADIASNQALFIAFSQEVVPSVIKYITNMSITGAEDAVQWLNISDAGLRLGTGDYARALGATPTTNSTTAALSYQADQMEAQQEARKPVLAQLFDTNDNNSAISRLVVNMPLNPAQSAVRGFASLMSNPLSWTKNFAALIPGAHADATTDVNPYNFVQYTFQGQNKYDPYENENYLRTSTVTVTYTDSNGNSHTVQVPMLPPLGDPTTYTPGQGYPGESKTDLLHCFVDNTTTPDYINSDSNGVSYNGGVCGSIGQFVETKNSDGSYSDTYTPPDWNTIYCQPYPQPCSASVPGDLLQRYSQYMLDWNLMKNLSDRTAGVTP